MRQGKGLYAFKNGCRYDGSWRKSVKYGFGKIIYPDGSRYEGEWKTDYKHGFGAYYYPNGDVYEGGWYKGLRHGLGTYVYSRLQVTFMGSWIHGTQEGPGQIVYPGYRYHGSWSEGFPDGKGFFVFDSCMQEGIYYKKPIEIEKVPTDEEMDMEIKVDGAQEAKVEEPVWMPIRIMPYSVELLPPQPMPMPITDSLASLSDDQIDSNIFLFEPFPYDGQGTEEEGEYEYYPEVNDLQSIPEE